MLHCLRWAAVGGFISGTSCTAALAAVLQVGAAPQAPYQRVADAVAAARDGDTIEVAPGTYAGDVLVISQRTLTIRGIGERPVMDAAGRDAEGKAIWVVRGGDIRIENIAFQNAAVADGNGAGIRLERGRLSLHRTRFSGNEMGILTANHGEIELVVSDSEFSDAPRTQTDLHHLLYVGRIARLEVRGSRFSNGWGGHLLKSRAKVNRIQYNWIVDGPGGEASYELDFPNGGDTLLLGNLIGQSATSQNGAIVSFGAEGQPWPDSRLVMAHNTLVNERGGGQFLRVWTAKLPANTPVAVLNNLTIGSGDLGFGPNAEAQGNAFAPRNQLMQLETGDWRPRPQAPWRRRGVDPRTSVGDLAVPQARYQAPVGTTPVPAPPVGGFTPGALPD